MSTQQVVIIGSGFSGLGLGIRLKQAGIDSFTILEKEDRLGGTWRDNTYPGAACDVPSMAYCFSFEPKTDWSRKWSPQPEILAYLEHCAEKYGLLPHLRFGTTVEEARFDESRGVWRIRTAAGDELTAQTLVSGVGQLHLPNVPDFDGLDTFRGDSFHSARWRHDVDLTGKRVAVIGNAASAVQFIPEIAPKVRELNVFQRSANWIIPRGDRAYRRWEQRLFRRVPFLARLYRWWLWSRGELQLLPVMRRNRFMSRLLTWVAKKHIRDQVADPELRKKLVPDYPIGARRVLIMDDYYPTLNRDNVHLVTDGIDRFTGEGIRTRSGTDIPADVVIFATGFRSTSFLAPMKIEGLGGRDLHEAWEGGARAYKGFTVPGFPNFFMMYGPNTNLGHNSIIFMIECQANYILQAIRKLDRDDLAWLDVRPEALAAWEEQVQAELARTVWAATDHSWYKQTDGRITNNWPGGTPRYWWITRRFDAEAYAAKAKSELARRTETKRAA